MAFVKDAFTKYTGGDVSSETSDVGNPLSYLLKVTAGTTYETSTKHQVIINGPPCDVDDKCKLNVRVQEYRGLPRDAPDHSPYFEDPSRKKDTYSLGFSWVPEEDVSAEDLVWGNELVNPIRDRIPKRFITTAFKIVKEFVDPSLRCDPYADEPWLNGPIVCSTAITLSIGAHSPTSAPTPSNVLSEGSEGDGHKIRAQYNIPDAEDKRLKHFASDARRSEFVFEKGRAYQFDFHNGYIDWKNYALKLPGFSLGVLKYIDNKTHTLRFVMKNRKTGHTYLVVAFKLLFGDELKQALKEEEGGVGASAPAVREHNSNPTTETTNVKQNDEKEAASEERVLPDRSSKQGQPGPSQGQSQEESSQENPSQEDVENKVTLSPEEPSEEQGDSKILPPEIRYLPNSSTPPAAKNTTPDVPSQNSQSTKDEVLAPAEEQEVGIPATQTDFGHENDTTQHTPSIQDILRETSTANHSGRENGMFS